MPGTIIDDEIEILDSGHGGGNDVPAGGDDDGSGRGQPRVPERAYFTAVQLALAGIIMFFMALTSSFLVRKGLGNDWVSFALPSILWVNTAILIASSATLEIARRYLRPRLNADMRQGSRRAQPNLDPSDIDAFHHWWHITTGLGVLFLVGQFLAWRQLAAQGVFLATNPSSSFFYLLTASHGLHLIGGVVVLLVVGLRAWGTGRSRISQAAAAGLAATYWHFLDGLWIFLLALLYLGR